MACFFLTKSFISCSGRKHLNQLWVRLNKCAVDVHICLLFPVSIKPVLTLCNLTFHNKQDPYFSVVFFNKTYPDYTTVLKSYEETVATLTEWYTSLTGSLVYQMGSRDLPLEKRVNDWQTRCSAVSAPDVEQLYTEHSFSHLVLLQSLINGKTEVLPASSADLCRKIAKTE